MFDLVQEYSSNPLIPYIRLFTPWFATEIHRCTAIQFSVLEIAEQGLQRATDDEMATAQVKKSLLPALDSQIDELHKSNEIDFATIEYAICIALAQFASYSLHASIALELLRKHRKANLRIGALVALLSMGRNNITIDLSELKELANYRLLTSISPGNRLTLVNSLGEVCDKHPELTDYIFQEFFRARVRIHENRHFLWLIFFAERGVCNSAIIGALCDHIRIGYDIEGIKTPTVSSLQVSRRTQAIGALHQCMEKNSEAIELYGKEMQRLEKHEDFPRRALFSAVESITSLPLLNTLYPTLWQWIQAELKPFAEATIHVYRMLARLADLGFRRDETIALFSEHIAKGDEIEVWHTLEGVKNLKTPSVSIIQQVLLIAVSDTHTNAWFAAQKCLTNWSENTINFTQLFNAALVQPDIDSETVSQLATQLGINIP